MMISTKKRFCFLIFIFALTGFSADAQHKSKSEGRKKVVFIASLDSHPKGQHEYNGGISFLSQKLKEAMPEIDTAVFHNGWPKDPEALKGASTIVLYCEGAQENIIIPRLSEFENLMNNGTGLVMLHFALDIPKGEDADRARNLVGGNFEIDWSVNPFWTPDIKKLPHHPVTNGVKPFAVQDEWYYHLRFVKDMKNITPILKVLPPDSTLSRPEGTHSNNPFVRKAVLKNKEPQIIAWTYDRPAGGRAFGFTGGHTHANWKNDNFRMLVLNAIVWTARIDVPKNGMQTKTPEQAELDKLTKPAQ
ncbi:ThuA domain-containing protein [Dyadobacter subterraneus]|uniref:ThuA domain-containing protein n=1 Tax=Dyadobacter subterraneus TaxID=2773304 RepID=A0ABR9W828_9BACT|nr:ThuA domain-containing protein [Dyadobacter subterraneus]MBE9461597.1 ThuA domain-containing protein [Dyadobacter subterraneus]